MYKICSYESPTKALIVENLYDDTQNEIVRVFNRLDDVILEVSAETRMFNTLLALMYQGIEVNREWMEIADHTAPFDRDQVADDLQALETEEAAVIISIMAIAFGEGVI